MTKHFIIPDTQMKPDNDELFLYAIGKQIVEEQPDVIVHLGDHWDFPSLSSYDSNRKRENVRLADDYHAGHRGMQALLEPLRRLQQRQRTQKKKVYNPRMVFIEGNHEYRLQRHIDSNPVLEGTLTTIEEMVTGYGWEYHEFKKPEIIDGVAYCHYFYNPMSGRPYGGQSANKLNHIGTSFVMGHQQGFQFAEKILPTGGRIMGMVAGSSYLDDEQYIGPQANHHWRGIVVLDDVEEGVYNFKRIDTQTLVDKFLGE